MAYQLIPLICVFYSFLLFCFSVSFWLPLRYVTLRYDSRICIAYFAAGRNLHILLAIMEVCYVSRIIDQLAGQA